MKKWDMFRIEISGGGIYIYSTNPNEVKNLGEIIVEEGYKYFSYINDAGKHKLEMNMKNTSGKGHKALVYVSPFSDFYYRDQVYDKEFYFFVLNILIANGWLPYPGDGSGESFIKYHG